MISIIFATYNEPIENLKSSISSVLKQNYENIEFITCLEPDEKNKELIKELLQNTNHLILEADTAMGLTRSLNASIMESKGEYIARMDSDDIWDENKLEKQLKFIIEHELDVVGCDVNLINSDNHDIGVRNYSSRTVESNFLFQNGICHPSVLIKKDLFQQFGPYDELFHRCEDLELWLRFLYNKVRFGYVPEILMSYRIKESYNRDPQNWKFNLKARIRYTFKIHRFDQSISSICVIFTAYIISLLGLVRIFNLIYRKLVINE